jgi:uncharacterized coiled-coil protein SlyX
MHHYQTMELQDDLVTIDTAGRALGIAPSAIGYWIVTGQLQATTTESGKRVSLSTVSEVARSSNVPVSAPRVLEHRAEPRPVPPAAQFPTAINAQAAESIRTSNRLARMEQRLAVIETTLIELRGLVAEQHESFRLVRQALEEMQSRDAASEVEPANEAADERRPGEPVLTLRLKPVADPTAPDAARLTESRRTPVPPWDTLRLVRKATAEASASEAGPQPETAAASKPGE